ncbi:hypothetical protein GVAV_000369 [Gurleya vavrai]
MKSILFVFTCLLIIKIRASNPIVSMEVKNPIGNKNVKFQNDNIIKQSNSNFNAYSNSIMKDINVHYNSKFNRFNRKKREVCEMSNDVLEEFLEPRCKMNSKLVTHINNLKKLKSDDPQYFTEVFFLINLIFPKITNLSSKNMHENYQINKEELDRLYEILILRSKIFEIKNQIENHTRRISFFARHYDDLVENNQQELIEQYLKLTHEKNEILNNLVYLTVKFKDVLCKQKLKFDSENKTPTYYIACLN